MRESDITSEALLKKALMHLRLLHQADSLTEQDVEDMADSVSADLLEQIRSAKSSGGQRAQFRVDKLNERLKKLPRYKKVVITWLRSEKPVFQWTIVKSPPVVPEIPFFGLTTDELDYARKFYQQGVHRLRKSAEFHRSYSRGDFGDIEDSLVEALQLEGLSQSGKAARLAQIGWPFPESADSQREFPGAKPVIEFIRPLVGEPPTSIPPLRRLLIEGSCLYADDSDCQFPTTVDLGELEKYVAEHGGEQFQAPGDQFWDYLQLVLWDYLQLVLCFFLGVQRPKVRATGASRSVMLLRIREIVVEIERKLCALPSAKRDIRVTLSESDLLNELLAKGTIADAVADAVTGDDLDPSLLLECSAYLQRQYDVLQNTPGLRHKFIGHVSRIRKNRPATGNQSILERTLIRHRLGSWLRTDCRALSWSDSFPKKAGTLKGEKTPSATMQNNIVGTTRSNFLPLGDYISLALGFPTTGYFVVQDWDEGRTVRPQSSDESGDKERRSLFMRFSIKRHVDDLISGLVGGATEPVLCRVSVACCPVCKSQLFDGRCPRKKTVDSTQANPCPNAGLHVNEFSTLDRRLIMRDASPYMELKCVKVDGKDLLKIADFSSVGDRSTVWFAMKTVELKRVQVGYKDLLEIADSSYVGDRSTFWSAMKTDELKQHPDWDRSDLTEQSCQKDLLSRLPAVMERLETVSIGEGNNRDYTAAKALHALLGLSMPKCPVSPRRSIGWIRVQGGDFTVWPPAMATPADLREKLRREFWSATREVLKQEPFWVSLMALNPVVEDRLISLDFLSRRPKNKRWDDFYARPTFARKLLLEIGFDQPSETAASDEVVQITSQSLLDWVIPAYDYPWIAYCRFQQVKKLRLPWENDNEIPRWWDSLKPSERKARLDVLDKVKAVSEFTRALKHWTPPAPDVTPAEDQQLDWNQVARGLWVLSFHELREQLWDQLQSYRPQMISHTLQPTTTKDSQS